MGDEMHALAVERPPAVAVIDMVVAVDDIAQRDIEAPCQFVLEPGGGLGIDGIGGDDAGIGHHERRPIVAGGKAVDVVLHPLDFVVRGHALARGADQAGEKAQAKQQAWMHGATVVREGKGHPSARCTAAALRGVQCCVARRGRLRRDARRGRGRGP